MFFILRTLLTCLALVFAASASGMRAPAVERVEATEAAAISINQLSLQNSAVFRRGYSIVCYQNIGECEAEVTADTAEGHPFKTTDGWRDAILLKKGGQLLLKGGGGDSADAADAVITIAEVRQEVKTLAVYNLEVANAHTFFVGADGVLVHNMACTYKVPGSRTKSGQPYVGQTSKPSPELRPGNGRDGRTRQAGDKQTDLGPNATSIDLKIQEQIEINAAGGLSKLDNVINSIKASDWAKYGISPPR
jgi:hypothetical protein